MQNACRALQHTTCAQCYDRVGGLMQDVQPQKKYAFAQASDFMAMDEAAGHKDEAHACNLSRHCPAHVFMRMQCSYLLCCAVLASPSLQWYYRIGIVFTTGLAWVLRDYAGERLALSASSFDSCQVNTQQLLPGQTHSHEDIWAVLEAAHACRPQHDRHLHAYCASPAP